MKVLVSMYASDAPVIFTRVIETDWDLRAIGIAIDQLQKGGEPIHIFKAIAQTIEEDE